VHESLQKRQKLSESRDQYTHASTNTHYTKSELSSSHKALPSQPPYAGA